MKLCIGFKTLNATIYLFSYRIKVHQILQIYRQMTFFFCNENNLNMHTIAFFSTKTI